MIVINFFGGPGTGKSTTAAGLFYRMKKDGKRVELVTEFAKELVWEDAKEVLADQLYLLANQNRKLERLRGKVDFAIADSPLLIAAYYGKYYGNHPEIIVPICEDIFNTYENINFFIERTKPYVKLGRLGGEESARKADKEIRAMLKSYISVVDNDNIVDNCIEFIKVRGRY